MNSKSVASTSLLRGKSFGFLNLQDSVKDSMTQDSCDGYSYYAEGDRVYENNENEKERKNSPWHRVKWTDQMVSLLITAVSYIGEDTVPKKGKWKAISKVMSERGFLVSPQQCEDKFNDLNKRYKKLNDILGRGISCEVVENQSLLDLVDISEKSKERVRKILSSKQLFYKEMCSYHNGNRLYVPHDHAIQKSLHSALGNNDLKFHGEETDASAICSNDNGEEKRGLSENLGSKKVPGKRKKPEEHEHMDSDHIESFQIASRKSDLHDRGKKWFISYSLQLEEQKLQIEAEMLELEKQRSRWLRFSEIEDRDLEKMKLENKYIKLENEQLGLDIRRRIMGGREN